MRFMAHSLCVEAVMSNFASDLLCLPNPPYLWQCVYKLVAGGVLLRLEVSSICFHLSQENTTSILCLITGKCSSDCHGNPTSCVINWLIDGEVLHSFCITT